MQLNDFLAELKSVLPLDKTVEVFSALREDGLIWKALENPEFTNKAQKFADNQAGLWNPATLALLSLEHAIPLENLATDPLHPLEAELRHRAAKYFEEIQKTPVPPTDLPEAGLLALALRERRRLKGSWAGLKIELGQNSTNGTPEPAIWQTAIACLFNIVPDPQDMLINLLSEGYIPTDINTHQIILHTILANPLSLIKQTEILSVIYTNRTNSEKLLVLSELSFHGRNELVKSLSNKFIDWVDQFKPDNIPLTKGCLPSNILDLINNCIFNLLNDQFLGNLHHFAGEDAEAENHMKQSVQTAKQIEEILVSQFIKNPTLTTAAEENEITAISGGAYSEEINSANAYRALRLLKTGNIEESRKLLINVDQGLDYLIANLELATQTNDIPAAKDYAFRAADLLIQTINQQNPFPREFLLPPTQLMNRLNEFELYQQCIELGKAVIDIRPTDKTVYEILGKAYSANQKYSEALDYVNVALLLSPFDSSLHKQLAELLENENRWNEALSEREKVLDLSERRNVKDLLHYTNCALRDGQVENGLRCCEQILAEDPENGLAHAYMGEAYLQLGEDQKALQHLTQATLLSPEEALPWINLATMQNQKGETRKALETLRAASLAAPDEPKIHFALANAYLDADSPTQALPALRLAFQLAPKDSAIALKLGETLNHLGHHVEAKQVLNLARQQHPLNSELAYAHALTLLKLGENQAALPSLLTTIQSSPHTVQPYLLYAKILLNIHQKNDQYGTGIFKTGSKEFIPVELTEVESLLQQAKVLDSENFEIKLLTAETKNMLGKHDLALSLFQTLAEDNQSRTNDWLWRIQLGIGRAAFHLGDFDTSLAALQEAAQSQQDNLIILQTLAEVYQQANLINESQLIADQALQTTPHQIDNLLWYAEITNKNGNTIDALKALERAEQLSPENPELLIMITRLQKISGDSVNAKKTLSRLVIMETINSDHLEKASRLFCELSDLESAKACLEKAIQKSEDPSTRLYTNYAEILQENHEDEKAIDAIQIAIDKDPMDPRRYLIQADSLVGVGRSQAALACLEKALHLDGTLSRNTAIKEYFSPKDIHTRIATIHRQNGDLKQALSHLLQAISYDPNDLQFRYLAGELAFLLCDPSQAIELLNWNGIADDDTSFSKFKSSIPTGNTTEQVYTNLLCLLGEAYLEKGEYSTVQKLFRRATAITPLSPRLRIDQIRVAALQADFPSPEDVGFFKALMHDVNPNDQPSVLYFLTIAETARCLHMWENAFDLINKTSELLCSAPYPHLCAARCIVDYEATQWLYQSLDIVNRQVLFADTAERYQIFKRELHAAIAYSSEELLDKWSSISELVFSLKNEPASTLLTQITLPDEARILNLAISRILQNGKVDTAPLQQFIQENSSISFPVILAIQKEDPRKALENASLLIDQHPTNPLFQALTAYLAEQTGEILIATQSIEDALAVWKDEPHWHSLASRLYQNIGNDQHGVEHLQIAVDFEPENPSFLLALGNSLLKIGDVDKSIQVLENLVQIAEQIPEAWLSLAIAYKTKGNRSKARICSKKTLDLDSKETRALLIEGEISLEEGDISETLRKAEQILSSNPSNEDAILLYIKALIRNGDHNKALAVIDRVIPTLKDPLPIQLHKIGVLNELKGPTITLEFLHELNNQYPANPDIQGQMAKIYLSIGNTIEAEKAAQNSLMGNNNQSDLYLLCGRLQRKSGNLDQAIYNLGEAIRITPMIIEPYLELGRAYQDRRDSKLAIHTYQKAIQLFPNDPKPYYQAGIALRENKEFENAESMLRKASELAPEDSNIRRQLFALVALNLVNNSQESSIPS